MVSNIVKIANYQCVSGGKCKCYKPQLIYTQDVLILRLSVIIKEILDKKKFLKNKINSNRRPASLPPGWTNSLIKRSF